MYSFIYRISIIKKIIIAFIPMLIAIIWLTYAGMKERIHTESQMNVVTELTQVSGRVGNVVHELQKERGMSVGFLASQGRDFRDELFIQRSNTDKAIADFYQLLAGFNDDLPAGEFAKNIALFKQKISAIEQLRSRVTRFDGEPADIIKSYTQTVGQGIEAIGYITHLSKSGEITSDLTAYFNLVNLKEQAGIERALLSAVFSANKFTEQQFRMLSDLVGKQEAWLAATHALSTLMEDEQLQQVITSSDYLNAIAMREMALSKKGGEDLGIKSTDWFRVQTQRIDALRQIEIFSAHNLQTHAEQLASQAREEWILYLIMCLTTLIIALVITGAIIHSIHHQLSSTLKSIKEMGGDLTRRLIVYGEDELSSLNKAYNQSIENIQNIVISIKNGARIVNDASNDIADGNQNLAQRTDEQSASIVETAASIEQISSAIKQTAGNAREAAQLATTMEENVQEASRIADEASASMNAIHEGSKQITNIVSSINEISFQTNLLSLNAAVEAARAGEFGKGFAVVASEVRNLSNRCTAEASHIHELVEKNIQKINDGVTNVTAAAQMLKKAASNTGMIKQYVSDMADAANEQSLGVSQIHQAISQLESVTQQNAALVSHAASASQQLDEQSIAMTNLVNKFIV